MTDKQPELFHLHIFNTTKQHHEFIASIPLGGGKFKELRQMIPIGRQIKFGGISHGGWEKHVIDAIVKHHSRYGMIHVDDAKNANGYCGLLWSYQPVESEAAIHIVDHNIAVLEDRGQEARERAAVATAVDLTDKTGTTLRDLNLNMDVREDTKDQPSLIQQGLQVTADPTKLQEAENMGRTILTPGRDGRTRKRA